VRVGALDVSILVDAEALRRSPKQLEGEGFSWSGLAEEGETAVE